MQTHHSLGPYPYAAQHACCSLMPHGTYVYSFPARGLQLSQTAEGSALSVQLLEEREKQLTELLALEKLSRKLVRTVRKADKAQDRIRFRIFSRQVCLLAPLQPIPDPSVGLRKCMSSESGAQVDVFFCFAESARGGDRVRGPVGRVGGRLGRGGGL